MAIVKINLEEQCGRIKPMHAVNNGPRQGGSGLPFDFTDEYEEMGVPFVRLHDTEGPYGSGQYVDMHCVFPDFSADENDEKSYNFKCTDLYLTSIKRAGSEIFYRLGESIDYNEHQLYVHPPKDISKWARICEHIIMHYNYGWANGYNLGIKYWEIWNEPDNWAMWSGTAEQFFEMYRITSNYLKSRFPDIKIGGYSASGFYAKNRENASKWFKSLIPFMEKFFAHITAEGTKSPLDFFSWHCYANEPEEVALHAKFARAILDKHGFIATESILTEYNNFYSLTEQPNVREGYASELAATFIEGQKSPLDMLMYYDMRIKCFMNGVLHQTLTAYGTDKYPAYYTFVLFNKLYKMGEAIKAESENGKVYVLGATDKKGQYGLLLSTWNYQGDVEFDFEGKVPLRVKCYEITNSGLKLKYARDTWNGDGFMAEKNSVYYLELIIN